jgi:hypothetical protein
VAACTTGSSQKIAAEEKPPVEGIRRLERRRLPEKMREVRRPQSHVLRACLVHPRKRSAATPKRLPWRGYSPDGEHSSHPPSLAQPCMGCKAGKGRGRNKPRGAIAALHSARVNVRTDPSRFSYDDSRTVRPGQVDAWGELQNAKRGETGTGARGAPVPEVGL